MSRRDSDEREKKGLFSRLFGWLFRLVKRLIKAIVVLALLVLFIFTPRSYEVAMLWMPNISATVTDGTNTIFQNQQEINAFITGKTDKTYSIVHSENAIHFIDGTFKDVPTWSYKNFGITIVDCAEKDNLMLVRLFGIVPLPYESTPVVTTPAA